MRTEGHFGVLPGVNSGVGLGKNRVDQLIDAAVPDAPTKLSPAERKIWKHVTEALLAAGLIHRTDGLVLTVICKTFVDWLDATRQLEEFKSGNGGTYITESANGYQAAHPMYYVARDLRKDLLKWLPEAALTIPSFQDVMQKQRNGNDGQGQLFPDPVAEFRARKPDGPALRAVK